MERAARNGVRRGRLPAYLAWSLALAYSLAPFDFTAAPVRLPDADALAPSTAWSLLGLTLHGLAFAVVGAVDRCATSTTNNRMLAPWVLLRGLCLCMLIEIGQHFLPSRHPALGDLLANLIGSSLGHVSAGSILKRSRDRVTVVPGVVPPAARPILLITWTIFWACVVLLPLRLVSLEDWDRTYFLVIGNELTAAEGAWNGSVGYVAIYDRALRTDEVTRAFTEWPEHAQDIRLRMGLLVGYDFTSVGQFRVQPTGRLISPYLQILVPAESRWTSDTPPALVIRGEPPLRTAGPAAEVTDAITSSNAFSVEVRCRPANLSQTGPARIVGISDSIWRRNFTIAQDGTALHFRVRNHLNGANGVKFALRNADALSDNMLHIVATYQAGVSSAFVNGRRLEGTVDLRQPSVLLRLGPRLEGAVAGALIAVLSLALILRSTA